MIQLPIEIVFRIIDIYKEGLRTRIFVDSQLNRSDPNHLSYRIIWKNHNLSYNDAIEWISEGWKVEDYPSILYWVNLSFSAEEATDWLFSGLSKYDYQISAYARGMNYTPAQFTDRIDELEKEYREWKQTLKLLSNCLDFIYSQTIRERVRSLSIFNSLRIIDNSELIINGNEWKSLIAINISHTKFKSLSLPHCKHLINIDLSKCEIKSDLSIFSQLVKLEWLLIPNNNFTGDLSSLSELLKLKSLDLRNNPLITGSLQSLEKLTELTELKIINSNITEGLEYLPDNLKELYCDIQSFPQLRGYEKNYCKYNYQLWKQNWLFEQETIEVMKSIQSIEKS